MSAGLRPSASAGSRPAAAGAGPAPRPAAHGRLPPALRALPVLSALLFPACGSMQRGSLIDLDGGRVLPVEIHRKFIGKTRLQAVLEDSTRLDGDFREVAWVGRTGDGPLPPWKPGTATDTLYYGSGYFKRDSLVIDFEYWRRKGEISAIGKASDNRGRRYKLLF